MHFLRQRLTAAALIATALIAGWPALAGAAQSPTIPSPAAASASARDVLARVRPAVIQIKGFFGTNTAQAFHGTGFAAAAGGIFITNYHVVAEKVHHPEKYRLEYRTPDNATGTIEVLAVDVRHDLAVVRAMGHAPEPLNLTTGVPGKGERAYSVGFPLDVGLTITEGVSNGKVEDSFDPRIHYSGALNGGMSGGPALNAAGDVIGVNVSGYRFSQLVSFLVPAEHAVALLARRPDKSVAADVLKKAVTEQMQVHSRTLLEALAGPIKTQVSSGYALPEKLAPFIDCSASGNPNNDQPVQKVRIACNAKAGLYLQRGSYGGDINFTHNVLTTEKLGPWRFAHRLSGQTSARGAYGAIKHVGPYACRDRIVALKGFDASVVICSRSYRKLTGLYDFTVRISSLNATDRGFTTHLDMYALEFDPAMSFIERFVTAMEWKP